MLSDLRFAARSLRRSPGFVFAAVLCLGLGLGANTTVYSFVNALLLRPLPYARQEALVAVSLTKPSRGIGWNAMSMPYFLDVREQSHSFEGLAAYTGRTVSLARAEGADAVKAAQVSAEYFSVVGVPAALGRTFRVDESAPGAPRVALLSDELWRTRFESDRGIVGKSVTLDGEPTTVIGVMPPSIGILGDREELWVPLVHDRDPALRANYYLSVIGRLRSGTTREMAVAELRTVTQRIASEHAGEAEWQPQLIPLRNTLMPGELNIVFTAMMGAVGFVLLIACASVANLLLARTAARHRELAVRLALGATRSRVIRLVLAEGVLVALGGGLLGTAIAYAGTTYLVHNVPVAYPSWIVFSVDDRVLVYAFVMALLTGCGFAMLPALRASRPQLAPALRDGGRGSSAGARRLREGLVMGALALSLVLLVGAGLMIKDVLRMNSSDPGFASARVLTARVYLAGSRYQTTTARRVLLGSALERVRAVPGVDRVAMMPWAPLTGSGDVSNVYVDGQSLDAFAGLVVFRLPTSGETLSTLGVPLVAGRDLTVAEGVDSTADVVVVNAQLAKHLWPNETALGKRISWRADSTRRWLTVVGVARDIATNALSERRPMQVWMPWAASPSRTMTLLVATNGDPASLAPAVRHALAEVDPFLPMVSLRTLDGIVSDATWRFQLYASLFGAFAVVALVLAVVGVYGVVAYQVSQRARELGVRVALGAQRSDVYRLVLTDGARLAWVGLAIGVVLALGLTRVLGAVLHGVSATDPLVFGGVTLTLGLVTFAASWIPARRATRVDPLVALRSE